jgi:ABC-type transport system involved in cytochrome bd biosynthesis fused ATPase/permease subunit
MCVLWIIQTRSNIVGFCLYITMSKLLLASLVALVLLSSIMLVPTLSAYADKGSDKALIAAKALTEAKAKAEAKAMADAKIKADADAKIKADADAKIKAEAEAKIIAEAKTMADAKFTAKVNATTDLKIEQKLPTKENDHKKGRHDPGGGPNHEKDCKKDKYDKDCKP